MEIEEIDHNLFKNLSTEQKGKIDNEISKILLETWNEKLSIIRSLQNTYSEKNLVSDQLKFNCEKEVADVNALLEEETNLRCDAEGKLQKLNLKTKALENDFQKANDRVNTLLRELEQYRNKQQDLVNRNNSVTAMLESKSCLLKNAEDKIKDLQQNLQEVLKEKTKFMLQAGDANILQLKLEFNSKRFEEEKSILTKHCDYLNSKVEESFLEMTKMREDHSNSSFKMQSSLNISAAEIKFLKEERDSFEKALDEKRHKVRGLMETLNAARESERRLEENYNQELASQDRIIHLYKASSEEQQKRSEELEKGIEELRQLLQESNEQFSALERAKKKLENESQIALEEKSLVIQDLKDEIDKINGFLNEKSALESDLIREISPSALAAKQIISKGLTLFQLHTEYINTTEKLFRAEEENKKMHCYVDELLKDMEDQAPTAKKQKIDNQELKELNNLLQEEIKQYLGELDKSRELCDEAERRANYLSRENAKLDGEVNDLSKQVTILLTQIEAARAGLPPPSVSILENLSDSSFANDVSTQRLVAFRNVSELQEQNKKLLKTVRDLTDKLDNVERTVAEEQMRNKCKELDIANTKLKELAQNHDKMESMMETLKNERDSYRAIADQKSPKGVSTPIRPITKNTEQLMEELNHAQKEIARLKKMHVDFNTERDNNPKLNKEEFERMKACYERTNSDNVRLLERAEYNQERIQILQMNDDSYQRQLKALEEKCTAWQEKASYVEGTLQSLKHESQTLTKKLNNEKTVATNLREERNILKENVIQLIAERDHLKQTQMNRDLINVNLQSIKNRMEHNDAELTLKYTNQIAQLTEMCSHLKSKIEGHSELNEAKLKIEKMQSALDASAEECRKSNEKLVQAEGNVNKLKQQIKEIQENQSIRSQSPALSSIQSSKACSTHPGSSVTGTVRELMLQLAEEKDKVLSLQATVELAQSNVNNLKQLLAEQETRFEQVSELNKKLNETISKHKEDIEQFEDQRTELNEKLKACIDSERALKDSTDIQIMKITIDLEERESELEEANKKLTDAQQMIEKMSTKEAELTNLVTETEDKYEREVMLHGADIQALVALKEKLDAQNINIESITSAKLKIEEALLVMTSQFEDKDSQMKKANEEFTSRIKELESQNQSLLEQFTQLSDKMGNLETKLLNENTNTSIIEEEARTSEQLREVIKYLRQERDLSLHKMENAISECNRLEIRKKSLEAQIEILNKNLAEEKQKNQTSAENSSQFKELIRKVETLNAVSDSNRLLREEKEKLHSTAKENQAKVLALETQIEPLQDKIRDITKKLDAVMVEKKCLQDEMEMYKKRSQELVEKLNKAKPEDVVRLQQELASAHTQIEEKQVESMRIKNMHAKLQKIQQMTVQDKNKLEQKFKENQKYAEENRRLTQEKDKLRGQLTQSHEKLRTLETNLTQLQSSQHQEMTKMQEKNTLLLQQIVQYRKSSEELRSELQARGTKLEEQKEVFKASQEKVENLEKQVLQLRKIATKYKKLAEENLDSASGPSSETVRDEKKDEESQDAANSQKEDFEKIKTERDALQIELQKLTASYSQTKENSAKLAAKLEETEKKYEALFVESNRKENSYESKIAAFQKEKIGLTSQIEGSTKKLSMQQKLIEHLQKQISSLSKGTGSGISVEKTTETPPTANIKPMAAPVVTPVAATRMQTSVQSGSGPSRSIPTASIRPLAPSSMGQSVVLVPPMEAYSANDGAVSSTVTLPQATVTPTPAVPTSTATQPFSLGLTATVSPTPVSASIAISSVDSVQHLSHSSTTQTVHSSPLSVHSSTSNVVSVPPVQGTSQELSVDSIISQAIALVAPHGNLLEEDDEPTGSSQPQSSESTSRKRKMEDDVIDEESKRTCVEVEEDVYEEEIEDAGEPSSSSSQIAEKQHSEEEEVDGEDEVMIVHSDDEEAVPTSQEGVSRVIDEEECVSNQSPIIMGVQSGKEAEMHFSSFESDSRQGRQIEADDHDIDTSEGQEQERELSIQAIHEQPSSSRQSLAPFQQLFQIEESATTDDRLVPSTPTLPISRQGEFPSADGVTSPQVPSQDFGFGVAISEAITTSHVGSAQIAEGGIDVTRMDLAQLSEGSHKSFLTAQKKTTSTADMTSEGNITSSAGEKALNTGERISQRSVEEAGSSTRNVDNKQDEPDSGFEGGPNIDDRRTLSLPLDACTASKGCSQPEGAFSDESSDIDIVPSLEDNSSETPAVGSSFSLSLRSSRSRGETVAPRSRIVSLRGNRVADTVSMRGAQTPRQTAIRSSALRRGSGTARRSRGQR